MKLISKAIFLGSKEFGFEIFKSLYDTEDKIEWIILCPSDANDSRTYFEEFNHFANLNGIDIKCTKSISCVEEAVRDFLPDIMLVVGYYQILPDSIIENIKEGVWGIHNSFLPKYRGSSPLVWQLINGEERIGSSLFKFAKGMDDGDILHQVSFKNSSKYTIKTATYKLQQLWDECLSDIWKGFIEEVIMPFKQEHSLATFCAKRKDEDGIIDWSLDSNFLDRFIRAQTKPYPMAFFYYENRKVRIISHELDERMISGTNGQVFESRKSHVTICCGERTALRLIELEIDGISYPAYQILSSINIRL